MKGIVMNVIKNRHTRRNFLKLFIKSVSISTMFPLLRLAKTPFSRADVSGKNTLVKPSTPLRINVSNSRSRALLKNGLIVDGTGNKAFNGDVLINGDKIEYVSAQGIDFPGETIDCTDKVLAPGFIDMHSHMDWVLPVKGYPELKLPFTAQGVTSFVAGNCGFGVAGFRKDSQYKSILENRAMGLYHLKWNTMEEYFDHLQRHGISHNLINLAGYGTTRTSIRGFKPTPLDREERKELLYLLEEAMDQGAYGVSFGLQYEPGVFATMDEMKEVATLVKKKDKIITVHMKAYSSLSPSYPLKLFGRPHNLLAIEDMLNLARETGVKLQLSHLIFVGAKTWKTCDEALGLIDKAIQDGVDVKFDTYAYHCGTSIINVFFPEWFLAQIPEAYESKWKLFRLRAEMELIVMLLGFGYEDIQITNAKHPELNRYNGMFLKDIAKDRGMTPFDNFIDFAKKSNGVARVLNHRYSNLENIKELMKHPASLYMTDATPFPEGVQNPGAYGNFPRFLQIARDFGIQSLEEAVYKMTGASANRFNVKERGILRNGYAADITVFDWKEVKDNNSAEKTNMTPSGIEYVFMNGKPVLTGNKVRASLNEGKVL